MHKSPKMPDKIPTKNPIIGKDHAAFVRLGGLFEKQFQLTGILVKNIIDAIKSWRYEFFKKNFIS